MNEPTQAEAKRVDMRPIIFSTPMVQAILAGRKTQTRRIIKDSYNGCWTNGGPHPCPNEPVVMYPGEVIQSPIEGEPDIVIDGSKVHAHFFCSTMDKIAYCHYGKPGDTLYVRESWAKLTYGDHSFIGYKADNGHHPGRKWKPSIHMPRAAARLFLKITDISVERLQDISIDDAVDEGIEYAPEGKRGEYHGYMNYYPEGDDAKTIGFGSSIRSFKSLWRKINGPDSWEQNPWIWKITFERIEKPTP